jgi:hypothetical protein
VTTQEKIFILIVVVLAAAFIGAYEYFKPARPPQVLPTITASVKAPEAPKVLAASPAAPTSASTAVTPSVTPPPATVFKAKRTTTSDAETAAYTLAYKNAATANALLGRHAFFTSADDVGRRI